MAKYSNITDCIDKTINVLESDLVAADEFVNSCVARLGVDPEDISPTDLLKSIAIHYASSVVCIRESTGDTPVMLDRSASYRRLYQDEVATLSKASLGLDTIPSSDWATIKVFRAG